MRGEILELYDKKDWGIIQTTLNSLNRFKRKEIFAESFVKAYGMKKIVENIGKIYLKKYSTEDLSSDSGPQIIVQIDGGFPFAFWWKDLLDNEESGLVRGKCLISGITNGDSYYPTMATSGAISHILHLYPETNYLFPIKELDMSSGDEDFYRFYQQHSYLLSRPVYQNRILIIGEIIDHLACCVPHLFHIQEKRIKTFETFRIGGTIENFLRDFGYGTKENTSVIVGKLTSSLDKENLQYSKDKGYPVKYLPDIQTTFNDLISSLESEISMAPFSKRHDIEQKLASLKSVCRRDFD